MKTLKYAGIITSLFLSSVAMAESPDFAVKTEAMAQNIVDIPVFLASEDGDINILPHTVNPGSDIHAGTSAILACPRMHRHFCRRYSSTRFLKDRPKPSYNARVSECFESSAFTDSSVVT